jgi:hypothetical protein
MRFLKLRSTPTRLHGAIFQKVLPSGRLIDVRFQVLTAASMKFRFVFW